MISCRRTRTKTPRRRIADQYIATGMHGGYRSEGLTSRGQFPFARLSFPSARNEKWRLRGKTAMKRMYTYGLQEADDIKGILVGQERKRDRMGITEVPEREQ